MFHLSLLIHAIQSSALSLCNVMMRKKAVSIAFFTRSILLVGETGQQEKPGVSLSWKVFDTARASTG